MSRWSLGNKGKNLNKNEKHLWDYKSAVEMCTGNENLQDKHK
jgi:hypothetical protein